jgi:aquaporin Z
MVTTYVPQSGWHWREWCAEFVGTALLLFLVVTAKYWVVRIGPATSFTFRVTVVGTVAGLVVIGVALSPLGRRSGAHLNPAVTIGFWVQRVVGRADVAGYCLAQVVGGVAGVAAARLWGLHVSDANIHWASIAPERSVSVALAATIEAAATFVQLLLVFAALTSDRIRRWAPAIAGGTLTASIVALAGITGAGFNPVRGLAPDVLARSYPAVWIYLIGPVAGGAGAAAAIAAWGKLPLTGKLCHDRSIPCCMRCRLPHAAAATAPENVSRGGEHRSDWSKLSAAVIAVEVESATDLPHRRTHSFLAATEVATVPNRQ